MSTYVFTNVSIYLCMYIRIGVCMCEYVYFCTYLCKYVCMNNVCLCMCAYV